MNTFLQLFLYFDIFIAGVVATLAFRHARAHYKPDKHAANEQAHQAAAVLPAEIRKRLLLETEQKFKTSLEHSAIKLDQDMQGTVTRINSLLDQLGTKVVSIELENYAQELSKLRKQAELGISKMSTELAGHETELKAKMAEEVETEKLKLIQQIDTKLADAVGSFLIETLGHNVDLGAQTAYLNALLEEHKAELIKEVSDETPTAG